MAEDANEKNNKHQGAGESPETLDDRSRREFVKKYGKLAAMTPVVVTSALYSRKALALSDGAP